jgi:DNA polymerase elongation subunit (family B)
VFEEINRLSKDILIKTKDVVQKLGYELIYADTDSVFIKNPNGIMPPDHHGKIVNILCIGKTDISIGECTIYDKREKLKVSLSKEQRI